MPGIEIKNLSKTYGEFIAIEHMDLSVPDGAFCVFLGPSGCGKTTTLNIVAGLDEATTGNIIIGGRDVTDLPPHERNIAMVFQSSLLYPHLTALENIKMSLRHSKASADEMARRIDEAVAMLNIEQVLGKKPSAMSGGQRQRVAMAKAIVRQPAAFLMDEPLAALDASLRQSLRTELVALQKRLGITTIFVTHDQIEAVTMGDLIVVMNQNRVEQIGAPDEIYNSPKTRFVAGFIGAPQINFLPGEVTQDKDGLVFIGAQGRIPLPPALAAKAPAGAAELCVRPEHVTVSHEAKDGASAARVFAVENLGKESVIILRGENGAEIRAVTKPDHGFKAGETAYLEFDASRAHLFAAAE